MSLTEIYRPVLPTKGLGQEEERFLERVGMSNPGWHVKRELGVPNSFSLDVWHGDVARCSNMHEVPVIAHINGPQHDERFSYYIGFAAVSELKGSPKLNTAQTVIKCAEAAKHIAVGDSYTPSSRAAVQLLMKLMGVSV